MGIGSASLVAQLIKNLQKKKEREFACNSPHLQGDPGLIPGSGRSPGEGKGCPLQYSWAFWWLSQ